VASDAHAHPFDLAERQPNAETERRALAVACAASAWNEAEFIFQEKLSRRAAADGTAPMALCFGAHPQLLRENPESADRAASFLSELAASRRIQAVGEIGFDLYDDGYRATETGQEAVFCGQLAVAREYGLPCVLHVRRAMHKAFAYSRELAALPAVVFHSYQGTVREAESLLKRGVNAYFSFGTPVLLNHKRAMEACASLPSDRILSETDAPYQPLRGRAHSSWGDLAAVLAAVASLRSAAGSPCATAAEVEAACDQNFQAAYGLSFGTSFDVVQFT
jgi:TatD DNase family protein